MTREQLQTIADLVSIAHDEYDGCPSYRDDLERYDRVLAEIKAEARSATGNVAAMRAALERIVGWCEGCHADACEKVCRPELTSESIHAALAALSAPARNCDVGTAEEQAERHERFCAAHYKADAVDAQCFGCPASDKKETDCEFVWGQLPFAPAKEPAK